jgi:hypothetical protein
MSFISSVWTFITGSMELTRVSEAVAGDSILYNEKTLPEMEWLLTTTQTL